VAGDNLSNIWKQVKSIVGVVNPAPNAAAPQSVSVSNVGQTTVTVPDSYYGIDSANVIDISSTAIDTTGWVTIVGDGGQYTIESQELIKIRKMEKDIEAIKDKLAILDEPSPEKLEQHKMLKEAYLKYKMIEKLIGDKDVGRDGSNT